MNKIKVVITKIPLRYYYYYQWLIFGLYELQIHSKIELIIRPKPYFNRLFLWNFKLYKGVHKYLRRVLNENQTDYLLRGYVSLNGKRQYFCYDTSDAPYYFEVDALKGNIVYFKAQCPKSISEEGFEITPEVKIPYHPVVLENKDKILPSMLGPGNSTYNIYSYKALRDGYDNLFVDKIEKTGELMCYFGSNKGPEPSFSYQPDFYFKEYPILSFFGNKVNHPNEKRGIAAKMISAMGHGYDGRIIKEFIDDSPNPRFNQELFISLNDYARHISKFKYNLNISGYRKSIPFRFIYSFCVGTAILTDKLFVKWYIPFENEVVETVDMGYLPNKDVDWERFNKDLRNLPEVNPFEIQDAFMRKWSPEVFAEYIINSCIKNIN